jgi:hypothetical protein
VDVTPPGGQPSPTSFASSPSLYGGQPYTTVSYESNPVKTGLWRVAMAIDSPEDLSNLDDFVFVMTYDITIPV